MSKKPDIQEVRSDRSATLAAPISFADRTSARTCTSAVTGAVLLAVLALFVWLLYPRFTYSRVEPFLVPLLLGALALEVVPLGEWRTRLFGGIWGRSTLLGELRLLSPTNILLLSSLGLGISFLTDIWANATGNPTYTVGGLIPWSDAAAYCRGAQYVAEFGVLDEWNCLRRPLPVLLYGLLFRTTGQNVQATVFIVTILVSTSIFFAAKTAMNIWGTFAGILMVVLLSCYAFSATGAMLTEPIGLTLGNMAFVFLAQGVFRSREALFFSGIGLLTLSQSVRPGALAAIPFAIAAGCMVFRRRGTSCWRVAVLSCIVCAACLGAGELVSRTMRPVGIKGAEYTNIACTFYGLVRGGKGWECFLNEHPELARAPEAEQARRAQALALQALRADPRPFLAAVKSSLVDWISHPVRSLLPFAFLVDIGFASLLLVAFLLYPFVPCAGPLRGVALLLGACAAGGFLSSPALVDAKARACAATVSLNCGLVVAGAGLLVLLLRPGAPSPTGVSGRRGRLRPEIAFACALAAALLVGPIAMKCTPPPSRLPARKDLAAGDSSVVFRARKGSTILLVDDVAADAVPRVGIRRFQAGNPVVFAQCPSLAGVRIGQRLLGTMDLQTGRWSYLVLSQDIGTLGGKVVSASVREMPGQGVGIAVFLVDSFRVAE